MGHDVRLALTCTVKLFVIGGELGHDVRLALTCTVKLFVIGGELGHDVASVLECRSPKWLGNMEARLGE